MSVLPKLKHEAKTMETGKQLIVIDGQAPGPSSYIPTPIYHDKITYAEVASEVRFTHMFDICTYVYVSENDVVIDSVAFG